MEFKELPHKVQEIAAQCLADKISYVSGFTEGEVKNEPAKDQARQPRSDREAPLAIAESIQRCSRPP